MSLTAALREFTREYELTSVKTTNMGSLFRLTYNITLRDSRTEKSLIDRLRCRNGNLTLSLTRNAPVHEEL